MPFITHRVPRTPSRQPGHSFSLYVKLAKVPIPGGRLESLQSGLRKTMRGIVILILGTSLPAGFRFIQNV